MVQPIHIIRGSSNTFDIIVADANRQPYELASGEKLLFGVKKSADDDAYLLLKSVTTGSNGVYSVKISPSDTEDLDFGTYVYDVGVQSGSDYYAVIPASVFKVCENVTKWGAQA